MEEPCELRGEVRGRNLSTEVVAPLVGDVVVGDVVVEHALVDAEVRERATRESVRDVVALLLAALGVALWFASLGSINPAASGDYGLVSQLPVVWWIAVVFVIVALGVGSGVGAATDRRSSFNTAALVLGTGALALILHGTDSAVETAARFPTAYLHAGFVQYIGQHGKTLPHLDLRMSWAGFFAGVAMASRAMGVSPTWFIRWAPLVSNLAYLIPLKVIADANLRSRRARWAALWFFLAANWIGQDYFSPQGMNLFLYLAVIAVVCRAFGADEPAWTPAHRLAQSRFGRSTTHFATRTLRLPSDIRSTEATQLTLSVANRLLLFVLTLVVVFASISSHQLTPVMIGVMAAALAVIGRTRLRALWMLVAAGVTAWMSFFAITYWKGHASTLFGGVGNVGGTLNQNVNGRLHGSSSRLVVLDSRIVFALVIWTVAVFGFVHALRRGRSHWTLLALFVCPFAVLLGQSYGGEAVLRVLLFTLPPASILVASLLDDPVPALRRDARYRVTTFRLATCVWVAALGVSVALFPIARWGNESFEAVSSGDLAAVRWVYANVPPGATLIAATSSVPWRYDHLVDYRYTTSVGLLFDVDPVDIHEAFSGYGADTYFVLTRDQANNGRMLYGASPTWLEQIGTNLASHKGFEVVYRNPDAFVVRVVTGSNP
jgi:hypothetical protein